MPCGELVYFFLHLALACGLVADPFAESWGDLRHAVGASVGVTDAAVAEMSVTGGRACSFFHSVLVFTKKETCISRGIRHVDTQVRGGRVISKWYGLVIFTKNKPLYRNLCTNLCTGVLAYRV